MLKFKIKENRKSSHSSSIISPGWFVSVWAVRCREMKINISVPWNQGTAVYVINKRAASSLSIMRLFSRIYQCLSWSVCSAAEGWSALAFATHRGCGNSATQYSLLNEALARRIPPTCFIANFFIPKPNSIGSFGWYTILNRKHFSDQWISLWAGRDWWNSLQI